MNPKNRSKLAGRVWLYAILIALLWTLLTAASLAWNVYHQHKELLVNAHLQADAYINKDLSFRSWATAHGGVYVRPDEKTPPNSYLKSAERDVVTTDGMKLTLINPAYMMRQVLEDHSAQFGIRGHLTSLTLKNPNNAPDPWERAALQSFENGAREVYEVQEVEGKEVFRHMRPIFVEQGCLKCHGDLGYKVGDIRGGISTMVDMEPLEAASANTVAGMIATHSIVWLVGLLGIAISARRTAVRAVERKDSLALLRRSEQSALALLALDSKAEQLDERALLQEGLEEAERLTSSKIAFLHFINDDQQSVELVTWSKRTQEQCQAVFDSHYPLSSAGIWADCARLKQPVVHNDYQSLPSKHGYPQGHSHLVRELTVPVVEAGIVRLIMGVGNKENNYDEADTNLVQMIANDLWKVVRRRRTEEALRHANEEMEQRVQERTQALSITNGHLSKSVAELQQHHREMRLINQLNDMLQSCQTREEAYRVIEICLRELFSVHSGILTVLSADRKYLEKVVGWGDTSSDERFALDDCWAMRQGHTHWVMDVSKDLLCNHFIRSPQGSYLCLPLIVQGEIIGLLHIEMKAAEEPSSHDALRSLAATVGEAIKLGLSNISLRIALREQATHDQLTGLYNRRYLDETLLREIHRALRSQSPLCAVMLDIDHFKSFNDTHGHEAGDMVLREIGRLLRDSLRRSDIACRYGGEEIAIIMPDSTLGDAQQRIEQIRQQLTRLEILLGGVMLGRVTVSAGVARMREQEATPDQLLRAADQALYAAKLEGRDRIVAYTSGMGEATSSGSGQA